MRNQIFFTRDGHTESDLAEAKYLRVRFKNDKTNRSLFYQAGQDPECDPVNILQNPSLSAEGQYGVILLFPVQKIERPGVPEYFKAIDEYFKRHQGVFEEKGLGMTLFFDPKTKRKYHASTVSNAIQRIMDASKCAFGGEKPRAKHIRHSVLSLDNMHPKHRKTQYYRARHNKATFIKDYKMDIHPELKIFSLSEGFEELTVTQLHFCIGKISAPSLINAEKKK